MMKSVRISVAGILLAALQIVASPQGSAATTYDTAIQINPAHTGSIAFPGGFRPPLKQIWSINLGGVVSYPLIADGIVYVTVGSDLVSFPALQALDLKTGATIWTQKFGGWTAYDNGRLFVVSPSGLIHAYSAESGALLWSVQLSPAQNWEVDDPPIAVNGLLYVGGNALGGTEYAFEETTGKLKWSTFLDNGASTAAFGPGVVYLDTACTYTSFNSKSGKPLWQSGRPCFGGGGNIPVYFDNQVFDQDNDPFGGSVVLTSNLGQLLWSFTSGVSPPAIWPGSQSDPLQISSYGSNLIALDAKNGSPVWTFTADSGLAEPPLAINNVVAIGSQNGTLYILNAATGAKLWSTTIVVQGIQEQIGGYQNWLGAGENTLVVPAETTLSAYVSMQ